MGRLRRRGLGGRAVVVIGVIAAVLLALALSRAAGSAGDPKASTRDGFASHRFGFSGNLPAGWHRSAKRLVPLLMPRELLSVGTAAMPVGGGGNCGRHPVASIDRMKTGDALISIQEYLVTRRMRPRLAQTFPLLTAYAKPDRLDLRRESRFPGTRVSPSRSLWSVTLPFRAHGRAFDALVYLRGRPSSERLDQVAAILAGLHFRPGSYLDLPGSRGRGSRS